MEGVDVGFLEDFEQGLVDLSEDMHLGMGLCWLDWLYL